MKCPIRRWVLDVKDQSLIQGQLECLEAACAWYDSIIQTCLIHALHTDLAAIHAMLAVIAKELTLFRPE